MTKPLSSFQLLNSATDSVVIAMNELSYPALIFDNGSLDVLQSNQPFECNRGMTLPELLAAFHLDILTEQDYIQIKKLNTNNNPSYNVVRQAKNLKSYACNFNYQPSIGASFLQLLPLNEETVTTKPNSRKSKQEIQHQSLLLSNNLPLGVYRSTTEGQIVFANNAMIHLLEFETIEELKLQNAASFFVDPEDRIRKIESLRSTSVNTMEVKLQTKTGKTLWVKDVFRAIFNSDNQIVFIEGLWEDLTEKKNSENALQEKTFFLNELVENVHQGIGLINSLFTITFCNNAFAALFELTPEQMKGKSIFDSIGTINRLVFEAELADLNPVSFEILLNIRNKEKYIQVLSKPRFAPNGDYAGAFMTLIDVTNRVLMENELIKARDKACEADQLKSTFLTNLSHEIRTPMNGVIGFATMLKNGSLSEQKRNQYLDILISRSKHMMTLLNDIIDATKIEQGHLLSASVSVNLSELIEGISHSFKKDIEETGKQISLICSTDLPEETTEAYIESFYVQQIIEHLLNNALKFTDEGMISIKCVAESASFLRVSIEDTGIGIAKNMHQIIFERFRQVDDSFTRLYGGMGLGLSICKGFVEHIGGQIWVESDVNKGAKFSFTFPYSLNEMPAIVSTPKLSAPNILNRHVLIVEDDPASYEYMKEVLSDISCSVTHAPNGSEAVRLINSADLFDLVLLDIQLPEKNGYEVAAIIRQNRPDIPIIAQTAHALSEDRKKCIAAGCNEYLTKPIMYDILLKTVKKYLG